MNNIIKEFASRAEHWATAESWSHGPNGDRTFRELKDEKFAELIVQECVDIANKSGNITNKSELAVYEANRIAWKIKKHFGIENEVG